MAAWTYPRIDPIALRLGPLAIRWYGLAYLAGFLFAWWVLRRLNKRWKLGLSPDDEALAMLTVVLGLIVGARLGYVLVYGAGSYWQAPLKILAVWDGGMSFHGGLVGLLLAGVFLSRRLKVPFLRLADWGAVAAPLGLALGRLGNFVNGELWGRETNVPWAMVFPDAGTLPRHPSQLYEAFLEGVVLLTVMLLLSRKKRAPGELLAWFLVLYGCMRIFVELFRQPDVQIGVAGFLAGHTTMGQLLSIPMLVAGAGLLWFLKRKKAAPVGKKALERVR